MPHSSGIVSFTLSILKQVFNYCCSRQVFSLFVGYLLLLYMHKSFLSVEDSPGLCFRCVFRRVYHNSLPGHKLIFQCLCNWLHKGDEVTGKGQVTITMWNVFYDNFLIKMWVIVVDWLWSIWQYCFSYYWSWIFKRRFEILSGKICMIWELLQPKSPTWRQMEATVKMQNLNWLLCPFIVESCWSQRHITHQNKISASGSTFAWMKMCKNKNLSFQDSVIIILR